MWLWMHLMHTPVHLRWEYLQEGLHAGIILYLHGWGAQEWRWCGADAVIEQPKHIRHIYNGKCPIENFSLAQNDLSVITFAHWLLSVGVYIAQVMFSGELLNTESMNEYCLWWAFIV